jgi:hypothetical protein
MHPPTSGKVLAELGLAGMLGHCRDTYNNAKLESFMKTLKVEAVYNTEHQASADVAADLPRFIHDDLQRQAAALHDHLFQPRAIRGSIRPSAGQPLRASPSTDRGALWQGGD